MQVVAGHVAVTVRHCEVGRGAGDVSVHLIDGFLSRNRGLDSSRDVGQIVVQVHRSGIVERLGVNARAGTLRSVHLEQIYALLHVVERLVHVEHLVPGLGTYPCSSLLGVVGILQRGRGLARAEHAFPTRGECIHELRVGEQAGNLCALDVAELHGIRVQLVHEGHLLGNSLSRQYVVVDDVIVSTVGIELIGLVLAIQIGCQYLAVIALEGLVVLENCAQLLCARDIFIVGIGALLQGALLAAHAIDIVVEFLHRGTSVNALDGGAVCLDERILGHEVLTVDPAALGILNLLAQGLELRLVIHGTKESAVVIDMSVSGDGHGMVVLGQVLVPGGFAPLIAVELVCQFAADHLVLGNLGGLRSVTVSGIAVGEGGAAATGELGGLVREACDGAGGPAVCHHSVGTQPAGEHTVLRGSGDGTRRIAVLEREGHAAAHGASQDTAGIGTVHRGHVGLVAQVAQGHGSDDGRRESNHAHVAVTGDGAGVVERSILDDCRSGDTADEAHSLHARFVDIQVADDVVLSVEVSGIGVSLRTDGTEVVVLAVHVDVCCQQGVQTAIASLYHLMGKPCQLASGAQFVEAVGVGLQIVGVIAVADGAESIDILMIGEHARHLGVRIRHVAKQRAVAAITAGGIGIDLSVAQEGQRIFVGAQCLGPFYQALVAVHAEGGRTAGQVGSVNLDDTLGHGTIGIHVVVGTTGHTQSRRTAGKGIVVALGQVEGGRHDTVVHKGGVAGPAHESTTIGGSLALDGAGKDTVRQVDLRIGTTHEASVGAVAGHGGDDVHGADDVLDRCIVVLCLAADGCTAGGRCGHGTVDPHVPHRTGQLGRDTRAPRVGDGADVDGQLVALSVHDAGKPVADVQPVAVVAVVDVVHELTVEELVVQRLGVGQPEHVLGGLHQVPSLAVALYEFVVVVAREVVVVRARTLIASACGDTLTGGAESGCQRVSSGRAAKGRVAIRGTFCLGGSVAGRRSRAIYLAAVAEGQGIRVLADLLCPDDLVLVGVQQEAGLAALHVLLGNLRTAGEVAEGGHVIQTVALAHVAVEVTRCHGTSALVLELEVVNVKTVLDDGLSLGPSHESAAVDGGSGGNGHGRHTVGHHTVCLGHTHDTSVCAVTGNSAHNGHRGGAAADDTAVLACNTCSELELSGDGTGGHHARDASLVAHVLEQGAAVLGREHVQLHRVALAVEASVVPRGGSVGHVHADHGAFDAVVDVGRQHCAGIGIATVHKVGKGLQVLGRTDLIDTVHLGECPCCRACHHHHGEQACVQ